MVILMPELLNFDFWVVELGDDWLVSIFYVVNCRYKLVGVG